MDAKNKINSILLSENVDESIRENLDFITNNIPEITRMIGFEHNNPKHDLDVFEHTLKALSKSPKDIEIRMALLLHDIGKPYSYQDRGKRRIFWGHSAVSANMSTTILKRLHYDEHFIDDVVYLVKTHNKIINVRELDNTVPMVKKRIEVQIADTLAQKTESTKKKLEMIKKTKECIYNL